MDRIQEARLIEFCTAQRATFSARAWLDAVDAVAPRNDLAAAAWLLASARWFGHRDVLLDVAGRLDQGGSGLERTIRESSVDPTRFSAMVRLRVSGPCAQETAR